MAGEKPVLKGGVGERLPEKGGGEGEEDEGDEAVKHWAGHGSFHGLMTGTPAAMYGAVSRLATRICHECSSANVTVLRNGSKSRLSARILIAAPELSPPLQG